MKDLGRAREFARLVANEIMDSRQFRGMIRETVLLVVVEQIEQQQRGAVRVFLDACQARGVRVWVGRDGQVRVSNETLLGTDLRAVLTMYRPAIAAHLERLREIEQAQRRPVKPHNLKVASP